MRKLFVVVIGVLTMSGLYSYQQMQNSEEPQSQNAPKEKDFSGRCTVFQPHHRCHNGCCCQTNPGFYNNRILEGAGVGDTTGNGQYYTNYNLYNLYEY